MVDLINQIITHRANLTPDSKALCFKDAVFNYQKLEAHIQKTTNGLMSLGLMPGDRVGIYLPKLPETVFSVFGTSNAGGVFVPINPLLKPHQVAYILKDCNVRVLITSNQRLKSLVDVLSECPDLRAAVVVEDSVQELELKKGIQSIDWQEFSGQSDVSGHARIDADIVAILYTSGSTGNPKGVVLSHRNMVAGAKSVAGYLGNTAEDRLLAVLPFSFDYGLSQLTTAFLVGASVTLMDYLLPRDILRALENGAITGLAAVPPIWNQLVQLEWPEGISEHLRYITNSGGAMPVAITNRFREILPKTDIFLMYGLTEAFRSTYLPPDQVTIRPESIGKAIPNAEILVVREDGTECEPGEPGELVHRGVLVGMGYWNDPVKTAERFKPCPVRVAGLPLPEMAVWSGDQVKKDGDGYLYFISRKDEMIKTSGYRVSPTEVEEVFYGYKGITEVAALGLMHPELGQAILLIVRANEGPDLQEMFKFARKELPSFMVPHDIVLVDQELPRNQNGKIDRKTLAKNYANHFSPGK